MPKEKSIGVVLFRKEDQGTYYLLLHYEVGHWDFPKGHIEKGEEEKDTAKREVVEETGIKDIRIINGFKEWIKYFFRDTYNFKKAEKKKVPSVRNTLPARNKYNVSGGRSDTGEWIFKLVIFYLAETKTKEVKISFEHIDYKWLLYEEALKQLTYKNSKEILKKANNFLTRV